MFCHNCGKEINDAAVICVGCGVSTSKGATTHTATAAPMGSSRPSPKILGFILSLCFGFFGLIVSVFGFVMSVTNGFGVGLVLFLLSIGALIASLLVSINEFKQSKENGSAKGFALAGIIVSACVLGYVALYFFVSLMVAMTV